VDVLRYFATKRFVIIKLILQKFLENYFGILMLRNFLDQKVLWKLKWLASEISTFWRAWPSSRHSWRSIMWRGRGAMLRIVAKPPTLRRWVIIIVYQYC